ncbi:hypothetical protein D3C81_881110 [compost metagenome]
MKSVRIGRRAMTTAECELVSRSVPTGVSRWARASSVAAWISASAGATRASSPAPASVRPTWRVVRCSSRTPSRSSRCRMVWETAEGLTASAPAAAVKLPSRATQAKAASEGRESGSIVKSGFMMLAA